MTSLKNEPLNTGRKPSRRTTGSAPIVPLAIVAAGSAWLLSLSFPLELGIAGVLLLLTVCSALVFRSALIPALLFLTQAVFFVTDQSSLRSTVTFDDQLIAGSLLVLLLSLQRYLQLPEPPRLRELLQQISDRLRLPNWLSFHRASEPVAFHSSVGTGELLLIGVRAIGAVVIASWLLTLVPNNPQAPEDVALIPTAQRTIRLGLGFAIVVILFNTLANSAAWRRLSPRAARLVQYSTLTEWCGRDIHTILRLKEKQKRRRH